MLDLVCSQKLFVGVELQALTTFDREEKKVYNIPITISDSGIPRMTGTSTLQVVIGDENDNPMKPGSSTIFVYTYKGESPDMEIGRVYVDDLDDWDLPDKRFKWLNGPHDRFDLKSETGMITMLQNTKEQTFVLEFEVTEQSLKISRHTVHSNVTVTVKEIPEEAVDKSGSVRLAGISAEEFITPGPVSSVLLTTSICVSFKKCILTFIIMLLHRSFRIT